MAAVTARTHIEVEVQIEGDYQPFERGTPSGPMACPDEPESVEIRNVAVVWEYRDRDENVLGEGVTDLPFAAWRDCADEFRGRLLDAARAQLEMRDEP